MKNIYPISFLLLLLFAGCEKDTLNPYKLKFYGDAWEDIGYSATITPTGYIIAGQFELLARNNGMLVDSLSDKNMAIIKTDWEGNVLWKVAAGGKKNDWGSKIVQLGDGSLLCVGTYNDTSARNFKEEVFIVKVSPTGEKIWQKTYGGAGNQRGKDVIKTPDGFMVFGTTDIERKPLTDSTGNKAGFSDIYLLKISDSGDSVGSFAYGYPGHDYASVIKNDYDGNFIVLGTSDRSLPGQGQNNLLLVRINSAGYAVEPRIIGGMEDEYAADMEVLSDGYLLTGTVGPVGTSRQAYVVKAKHDIYATPWFTKTFRINETSTSVNAMTPYGTGNYLLAGYLGTSPGTKMLVLEMDSEGNPVAGNAMIKGNTGDEVAYDVVSGDDGYIIAVGRNKYDVNSMISLLKFRF